MEPSAVFTSSQTNQTNSSVNAHSIKTAIFKTVALKIGNEINNDTIAPSTGHAFLKSCVTSFFYFQGGSHLNNIINFLSRDLALQFVEQTPAMSVSLTALLLNKTNSNSSPPLMIFAVFFFTVADFCRRLLHCCRLCRPLLHHLTYCRQHFLNFAECFKLFQTELHFN